MPSKSSKAAKKPAKKPVPAKKAAAKKIPPKPAAARPTAKTAFAPPRPFIRVNKEKEAALREAAKIAEALATKVKEPLTSTLDKKPLKPVDPKEAARAIKQIKTSFFASMATSSAPTAVTTSANSPFPPRVQALLDKQEITDLMYAYARGIDRAEENLVRSVFHPDANIDFGPGIFQGGVPEFISWALEVRGGMRATHHMVANIRIDLRGDNAHAEAYFMNWHRLDKSTGKEDFFVGGRYLDKLERRPGGAGGVWKIAHRKQVKDWTRTTPVAELFYHLNPDALWAHHSRQDLSYQIENFPTGKKAKTPTYLARRYDAKSMKV
jgi:hypothetical protein